MLDGLNSLVEINSNKELINLIIIVREIRRTDKLWNENFPSPYNYYMERFKVKKQVVDKSLV